MNGAVHGIKLKKGRRGGSLGERAFDAANAMLMLAVCLVTLYPFWNVFALSLNDGLQASIHPVVFLPNKLTLGNYVSVFSDSRIFGSFVFTVYMTVVCTLLSVLAMGLCAYALSKEDMPGVKFLTLFLWVGGWFSGGMIPTFIMYRYYGLLNSFWVFIIPAMFTFYNFLILRTNFREFPISVEESAIIDGAGYLRVFLQIVFPMSLPVFATITLFVAVGAWNDWMTSLIYAYKNESLRTLQYFLNRLLQETEEIKRMMDEAMQAGVGADMEGQFSITPQSVRSAVTMVATIPIIIVYPFLQKYFVKGVRLGAVKE